MYGWVTLVLVFVWLFVLGVFVLSETPKKDHTSTLLRMAGNIAAGLVTCPTYHDRAGVPSVKAVAADALEIAREILKQATEDTP